MNEPDPKTLDELRGEISALMGRCILKLQAYELALKECLATSSFKGADGRPLEPRSRHKYTKMTLGQLINELTGTYVTPESAGEPEDEEFSPSHVHLKISVQLSDDQYAALKESLRILLGLRNELVHHFLSAHPLHDVSSCLSAKEHLTESLSIIDTRTSLLRAVFQARINAGKHLLELSRSGELDHLITYGFIPGQPVDWRNTRVVELLQAAESKFQRNGWTDLSLAIDWIRSEAPQIFPEAYGCSNWQAVLNTSSLFDICEQAEEGTTTRSFYRSV
ncbi:hypothetical protein [Marinobacter sp. F4216]|uniref:hypothetical protein n=1 Tax=Marinobacter sp. F4216 TaxID=2874281 RepID=UPI001CC158B6|nr:hypothetical protein [Marinobacter sp. F4216]